MELAEHLLKQEPDGRKIECIDEVFRLLRQVTLGYGLGEPYYLVLDNDVLNALQKPNVHSVRYIALIILFRTIKKINKDFRIAINPVTFFEFNNEGVFQSYEGFERGWANIRKVVERAELPIYSCGLSTFRMAKKNFKSIKHDIKEISAALGKIKNRDWKVNLNRGFGVTFPHVIAREECPKITVKFFSEHHTRIFLESVIESKIVHHKGNDCFARKKMRNDRVIKKSKLLETKKDHLSGVGDLSLLSLCDIASQFHSYLNGTSIAITFDKRLESIIVDHSRILVQSQEFMAGKESDISIGEKMTDFIERSQVVRSLNKETAKFFENFVNELRSLIWLREAIEGSSNRH